MHMQVLAVAVRFIKTPPPLSGEAVPPFQKTEWHVEIQQISNYNLLKREINVGSQGFQVYWCSLKLDSIVDKKDPLCFSLPSARIRGFSVIRFLGIYWQHRNTAGPSRRHGVDRERSGDLSDTFSRKEQRTNDLSLHSQLLKKCNVPPVFVLFWQQSFYRISSW